ncbi:DDE-type integrase/transposase/recombinase [Candidatus Tokpelaia sp.]|uniref:DDE-type integrase/transposase/recombinase n=1 Tax=Candidatus Tokpelaia sp. TaxID=2233777 RepID=UPI001238673D|nr:DDE-type integrase/transposase/recombinase [Candidatus Tokpelaia sp.]KAA6405781.1 hypothetical protein DPQ22_02860 [Candidatus Tokpelaia sp.]
MSAFQQYYTDAEIAEAVARLVIADMPTTRFGIKKLALREGWRQSALARIRAGREGGGGWEYHFSLLPLHAQEALQAEFLRLGQKEASENMTALSVLTQAGAGGKEIAPLQNTADLTARQREVMEARLVLVREIERQAVWQDIAVSVMIEQFLAGLSAGTATEQMVRMAAKANDKSREDSAPLSARTVMRWIKRYRQSGCAIAALAPAKRQAGGVPHWIRAFYRFYGLPSKPSMQQALDMWRQEQPRAKLPSIGQIRTAMGKMTMLERNKGRMGPRELKKMQSYISRDTSDMMPAEMYQADGKTFNAEIAHPAHGRPFRPELTTIIDAKTRRVVGWSAALDESANAVADALLMAVSKAGIPAIFYTDNGPGYKNAAMEDSLTGLLERLSITPMHALPYNSQAKGLIERFNRHWTNLARTMPTYLGGDMDKEAAQAVHKVTRKELAETGISATLPSWAAFMEACADMIADYNARPHRSLDAIIDPETGKKRHLSPNEAWRLAEAQGWTADIVDAAELAELRLIWEIRRTRRGVVELFDNQYFCGDLESYHGEEVIIAYDPTNADSVICRAITMIDGERRPGALIGKAAFAGHKTRMVPMTAAEKAAEKRHKGRRARVGRKADVIDAELRTMVIAAHTTRPLPQIVSPVPALEAVKVLPAPRAENVAADPNARPNFKGDIDYALWLIANPERATAQDRANIREDLLATHAMKDWLSSNGVNLQALVEIARASAAA